MLNTYQCDLVDVSSLLGTTDFSRKVFCRQRRGKGSRYYVVTSTILTLGYHTKLADHHFTGRISSPWGRRLNFTARKFSSRRHTLRSLEFLRKVPILQHTIKFTPIP